LFGVEMQFGFKSLDVISGGTRDSLFFTSPLESGSLESS